MIPFLELTVQLNNCVDDPEAFRGELDDWIRKKLNPDYFSDVEVEITESAGWKNELWLLNYTKTSERYTVTDVNGNETEVKVTIHDDNSIELHSEQTVEVIGYQIYDNDGTELYREKFKNRIPVITGDSIRVRPKMEQS